MLFDLISGEVICLSGNAAWSFSRLQLRGLLNYLCPVISNLKMECVLGIACNDFVILASDMTNAHSIIVNKQGPYFLNLITHNLFMFGRFSISRIHHTCAETHRFTFTILQMKIRCLSCQTDC